LAAEVIDGGGAAAHIVKIASDRLSGKGSLSMPARPCSLSRRSEQTGFDSLSSRQAVDACESLPAFRTTQPTNRWHRIYARRL